MGWRDALMWKGLFSSLLVLVGCAGFASGSDLYADSDQPGILPWYVERVLPFQTWCGYPHTFWLSAEFQAVVMKDGHLPPLVTAGPAGSLGILGQPGTVLLYGDEDANHNPFLGGKFMGGAWGDYEELYGIEGGFTYASEQEDQFVAFTPGAAGSPIIARPVINAQTGQPSSSLALIPGFQVGTIDIQNTSSFLGAEGHLIRNCWCFATGRIDLIAGFRYLELDENLYMDEVGSIGPPSPLFSGFRAVIADDFEVRTRFYGGYLGAKGEFHRDHWTLDVMSRVAIGSTQDEIGIEGVTAFGPPVGPLFFRPGGLLALATNAGVRQKDVFGVVPEVSVRVGCQILERLNVFAGFSALYWNKVVRVGDQVNLTINPSLLPSASSSLVGPPLPNVFFHQTDFWLMTGSVGLEVRY